MSITLPEPMETGDRLLRRPGESDSPVAHSGIPEWLLRGRVPCLDGLRAVSIAFVIVFHAQYVPGFSAPRALGLLADRGMFGVDFFFAISGFLITLLLMRELTKTGTISLLGFYQRRVLRILPAYVAFLLTIFTLTRLSALRLSHREWLAALTYSVNLLPATTWQIQHLWSLSFEEQFYLIWPPVLLLLGARRGKWLALGLLIGIPLLRAAIWGFNNNLLWSIHPRHIFNRCDCVIAGCTLALWAVTPGFARWSRLTPGRAALLAALSLTILAVSPRDTVNTLATLAFWNPARAVAITALIWVCATHSTGPIGRLLCSPPLTLLGVLSYSLYLWQQLFLDVKGQIWCCRWPAGVGCALVAAVACHLLVERPFLRWKGRLKGSY